MIEFGKDHSPAWLELMSAYQIFRARLFDWSREPDQVKQRDLLLELGSWENRDLNIPLPASCRYRTCFRAPVCRSRMEQKDIE